MNMNFIKVTQIIAVSIAFCSFSFGQVGVNTPNPNSSAALEVVSPSASDNRGVLLPRMTTAQMNTIATNATTVGLMVFNTDEKSFYYHDGTDWIALVPKQPLMTNSNVPQKIGNIVIDSGAVITQNATVNGDLNVNGFAQNALVPTGAIMMWSGSNSNIPAGWGLCDGSAGKPDLRGRFIIGFDNVQGDTIPNDPILPTNAPADGITTNYGRIRNTGGETGHQLTTNEIPQHNHTFSGTTNPNGNHTHSVPSYDGRVDNNDGLGDLTQVARPGGSVTSSSDGNHNHTFTGTTDVNVSTNSPHENRPPYYVLAYIIKLP